MKNKRIVLIIVLIFVLLIGGATVLYRELGKNVQMDQLAIQDTQQADDDDAAKDAVESETETETETEQNTKAPDFTVYDADGNEVYLSDYIGKPIVLNFWASWCGPCQSEMPGFHEKYLELGEEVTFLMINMTDGFQETKEKASDFIAENEYTFPVFYDTKSDAAYTYGAYSLPTTFFIDADGYVIAQATGAIDAKTLQRGIDMIQ